MEDEQRGEHETGRQLDMRSSFVRSQGCIKVEVGEGESLNKDGIDEGLARKRTSTILEKVIKLAVFGWIFQLGTDVSQ